MMIGFLFSRSYLTLTEVANGVLGLYGFRSKSSPFHLFLSLSLSLSLSPLRYEWHFSIFYHLGLLQCQSGKKSLRTKSTRHCL